MHCQWKIGTEEEFVYTFNNHWPSKGKAKYNTQNYYSYQYYIEWEQFLDIVPNVNSPKWAIVYSSNHIPYAFHRSSKCFGWRKYTFYWGRTWTFRNWPDTEWTCLWEHQHRRVSGSTTVLIWPCVHITHHKGLWTEHFWLLSRITGVKNVKLLSKKSFSCQKSPILDENRHHMVKMNTLSSEHLPSHVTSHEHLVELVQYLLKMFSLI